MFFKFLLKNWFDLNLFFSFVSVWTLPDIVHAIRNGDQVLEIFEILAYESSSNYLKKFLDILSSYKIRHSAFNCSTTEELQKECDKINEEMGFTSPELLLSPDKLQEDPQLKEFFKLWSNALLGKKLFLPM